jgi:CVNH domain
MFDILRRGYLPLAAAVVLGCFVAAASSLALACDCGQDSNGNCLACNGPGPSGGGGYNRGHPGVQPHVPFNGGLACYVDQPPRGSYQRSCQSIGWDCKTLTASCKSRQGSNVQSSLTPPCIGDIANMNGVLRCSTGTAPPSGPYTNSCRDIWMGGGLLNAECRHSNGQWTTSPPLRVASCRNGIDNIEGTLKCR